MKILGSYAAVILLMLSGASTAAAQTGIDMFFGLGSATDGSSNRLIDLSGSGNPVRTPSLGGVFGRIGGDVMLTDTLGIGAEAAFRFSKGEYGGLSYRPVLYDFNGIWMPLKSRRVVPEFQAGLGGASMRFYGGGALSCDYYTGRCSDFAGSSNHFQLHAGAGIRFYVKERIFVRPQFDLHWIKSFTDEFKSNAVPAYTIAIGYSSR